MRKPKLIYYNDARHYSLYRYDSPMSLHQLRWLVDEILGTEVDTLVYGLASGQTFLHGSQVGLKWGQGIAGHNHGVMWWRAAENLTRAHEKGRRVLCSLRMNDPTSPESGNPYVLSQLKREELDPNYSQ